MRAARYLALPALVLTFAACGSSPAAVPSWLKAQGHRMALDFGDTHAKASYILGPKPIIVLKGHLFCGGCSYPAGPPPPEFSGTVAAARFNARTHKEYSDPRLNLGHDAKTQIAVLCAKRGPRCSRGG